MGLAEVFRRIPENRLRLIRRVFLALLIFVLGTYLGELSYMRHRYSKATQLINSVQQLKIGITSSDQVRQLSERYAGRFYADEGSDTHSPTNGSYLLQVWSPYLLIRDNVVSMKGPGLRLWVVSADIQVVDDRLSGLSLRLATRVSNNLDLTSAVSVSTRTIRAPEGTTYFVAEPHVTGPPTEALHIELSPKASSEERKKAFDFNSSCLTSFRECRNVCEISPDAWNDLGEHRLRYDDGREKVVDAECRQRLSQTK